MNRFTIRMNQNQTYYYIYDSNLNRKCSRYIFAKKESQNVCDRMNNANNNIQNEYSKFVKVGR